MACMVRVLKDGDLQTVDYSAESLADAVRHEPHDGVYTVSNTYNTFQTLKLDDHLDRLQDSAVQVGISLTLDRPQIKSALRRMIAEADYGDVRFRITAARGSDALIISIEPYQRPPAELVRDGVRVITAPDSARHQARAKTTDWMHQRRRFTESMPEGVYDVILLDADGRLLEGLGANFYAILDGTLRTATEGVLAGIAQRVVFAVASDVLPVVGHPVHISDVAHLSEAFITSSSRGIIPVVQIDGHTVGAGVPGRKTRALHQLYRAWVDAHLETL